jgi:hypothetical protein
MTAKLTDLSHENNDSSQIMFFFTLSISFSSSSCSLPWSELIPIVFTPFFLRFDGWASLLPVSLSSMMSSDRFGESVAVKVLTLWDRWQVVVMWERGRC